MPLDFCIRNNHDQIIILVPVDYNSFNNIIESSKSKSDFYLIRDKLKDYFEDAEFFTEEIPQFKNELSNLKAEFINEEKTSEIIYLLIQLCDIAVDLNKSISVFAD